MVIKPIRWVADSRRRIGEFSQEARQIAGFELWEVQQGNEPSDWKPMTTVGSGVKEIRIHVEGEYRVLYVAKFEEAVYVLHVFQKKTQRTPKPDIEIASNRYRALLQQWRKP
jgi:phage-related protein